MRNACLWSASLALAGAFITPARGQQLARVDTARLQRLLVAEDNRGTGVDGINPLLMELRGTDSLLRRVALRGLGRLQRPELVPLLLPTLADPIPTIRSEAANAIAQSVNRVRPNAADSGQVSVRPAARALASALATERDDAVADAIAEALGRLPFGDSAGVQGAAGAILDRAGSRVSFDVARGLYRLTVNRRATGGLTARAVAFLRDAAHPPRDATTRRMAVLALSQQGALDSITLLAAVADPDEQVRRLALAGAGTLAPATRANVVRTALADQSPIVRIAAIAGARAGAAAPDCMPITAAASDRSDYVALAAIDALGLPCAERSVAASVLMDVIDGPVTTVVPDHRWQRAAHALVALARIDSALVAPFLARFAAAPRWGERMFAAEAAGIARNRSLLTRLVHDADNNVRATALDGLARSAGHDADTLYIAALTSPGNQVVLAAAQGLAGSMHAAALPALLDAFDSIGARRSENVRDPRLELLKRIGEMGSAPSESRLKPYLADFDTTVAATVAAILSKWSGAVVRAAPRPLPIRPEPLATLFLARDLRLRVTMAESSGGGSFTVRLFPDEAPATVARIIRLARAHYYDGHILQRVEPNFVIQGGGPDASEYVGDATFMRDELTPRSHFRGTLGISSRGRDTGDAQWFINLVDNPRLDHDYTVFGEVASGRGIVDQILEGDVIAHVEVIGAP